MISVSIDWCNIFPFVHCVVDLDITIWSYKEESQVNQPQKKKTERSTFVMLRTYTVHIMDRFNIGNIQKKEMDALTHTFSCLERRRTLSLAYIEHDICSMRC